MIKKCGGRADADTGKSCEIVGLNMRGRTVCEEVKDRCRGYL